MPHLSINDKDFHSQLPGELEDVSGFLFLPELTAFMELVTEAVVALISDDETPDIDDALTLFEFS